MFNVLNIYKILYYKSFLWLYFNVIRFCKRHKIFSGISLSNMLQNLKDSLSEAYVVVA